MMLFLKFWDSRVESESSTSSLKILYAKINWAKSESDTITFGWILPSAGLNLGNEIENLVFQYLFCRYSRCIAQNRDSVLQSSNPNKTPKPILWIDASPTLSGVSKRYWKFDFFPFDKINKKISNKILVY